MPPRKKAQPQNQAAPAQADDNLDALADMSEATTENIPTPTTATDAKVEKVDLEVNAQAEAALVGETDPKKLAVQREEKLAKVTARLGSREYEFPLNDPEDIRIALYLSQYFQKENLVNGQILTFNFHQNQMMFLPDLDLELNMSNPSFTYHDQTFHEFQTDEIVKLIRSQALVLGDYGLKAKKVKAMDMGNMDFAVMLDKNERQIFADIKSLAQESTYVDSKSGEVKSPVPVLKAMYEYERNHKSRKKVMKMIDRALNHIGGSVQFLDKMTDMAPAGTVTDNPATVAKMQNRQAATPSSDDF